MKSLTVNASGSYEIRIGSGLLADSGEIIRKVCNAGKICIVTDDNVAALYAHTVKASLEAYGYKVYVFTFPHGESSKTLSTVSDIYTFLAENRFSRTDALAALGGGVTGDITGFAAATYLRGIPFIQLPTSLLAQVDSSVGGKTGVDIPAGKNLVGAFKQPILVLCDTTALSTLPDSFLRDGAGEIIKYAMIKSHTLFDKLMSDVSVCNEDIIFKCVDIKRKTVEADEFDTGERMLLNFGHTLGHAIEKEQNFCGLPHGSAVAVGMSLITSLSQRAGLTSEGTSAKLDSLIKRFNLPTSCDIPLNVLMNHCLSDKKCLNGRINTVICKDIGKGVILPLSYDEFKRFLGIE